MSARGDAPVPALHPGSRLRRLETGSPAAQRRAPGRGRRGGGARARGPADLPLGRCQVRRETSSEELCRGPGCSPFSLRGAAFPTPSGTRVGVRRVVVPPGSSLPRCLRHWGVRRAIHTGVRWAWVCQQRLGPGGVCQGVCVQPGCAARPGWVGGGAVSVDTAWAPLCCSGCRGVQCTLRVPRLGRRAPGAAHVPALIEARRGLCWKWSRGFLAVSTRGTRLLKKGTFTEALQKRFLLAIWAVSAVSRGGCGPGQSVVVLSRHAPAE